MWIEFTPSKWGGYRPYDENGIGNRLTIDVYTQRFEWSLTQKPAELYACSDVFAPVSCLQEMSWVYWFTPPAEELGCYSVGAHYTHPFLCPLVCEEPQALPSPHGCWAMGCPEVCEADYSKPRAEWTEVEYTGQCWASNEGWTSLGIASEEFTVANATLCDPSIDMVLMSVPEPEGMVLLVVGAILLGIFWIWGKRRK